MNKKKLEEFRTILTKKMKSLVDEAKKSMGDITETKETFADPTDLASFEADRNFLLRIKDRERKHILKIKEVLKKIDDGSYGICEICGEDIDEKRLKLRPETTFCIECKTEMEHEEKKLEAQKP
jgi:DnaK suppressor protein